MDAEEFVSLQDEKPKAKKYIVVTNNIDAKNAHGEMSHVWMTNFLQHNMYDGYLIFDDADRCIIGITHWKYV